MSDAKAIEAAARALSERSGFALAGDWDAQVQHDQRMIDTATAAIRAYNAAMEAEGSVLMQVERTGGADGDTWRIHFPPGIDWLAAARPRAEGE